MENFEEPINAQSPLSLDVLIIGAGTAGLLLALECKRQGFNTVILERLEVTEPAGDIVVIGPSAVKVFSHWPRLDSEFQANSYECQAIYHRHTGEIIAQGSTFPPSAGRPMLRRKLQSMLEQAVHRQNIPIKYGHKVVSYFESDKLAGVEVATGERITADLVVACDGMHSRSATLINGAQPVAISSGQAVFRTTMSMSEVFAADPSLKDKFDCPNGLPYLKWFWGPNTHSTIFGGDDMICWSIHHPENANTSTESWSTTVGCETVATQVLQDHPDWDPDLLSLVRSIPNHRVNDWLLMFRDPEPNWVSRQGRVVQCGDSAHPFLPTSANGSTQAMEDAVSLASALRQGLNTSVLLKDILRTYNEIRFKRTSCAQLMGFANRQVHHHTDFEELFKNPSMIQRHRPGNWIGSHDPEKYMVENFEACLDCVRNGRPFENTNIPVGFTYRDWSCLEILKQDKEGKMLELEGYWE